MSGGFAFSDEGPRELKDSEHTLPLITLLRRLWGYRVSLVAGESRADLLPWWEQTKALAPHWAGFSPERCSAEMRAMAQECDDRCEQFSRDLDSLDAEWRRSQAEAKS
jgi:hypothetical protein